MPSAITAFVEKAIGSKDVAPPRDQQAFKSVVFDRYAQQGWLNSAQDPLAALRTALEQHQWDIVFVDECHGNEAAWRAWFEQHRSLMAPADFVSVSRVDLQPTAIGAKSTPAHIEVDWFRCHRTGEPGSGMPWVCGPDPKEALSAEVALGLRWDHRRLPAGWFRTRFPALDSVWESAREHDIPNALRIAKGERLGELFAKKATLLGLEIESTHLGIIGPSALLICILYLAAYVRQVRRFIETQPTAAEERLFISPWIGAVYDPSAGIYTWTMRGFTAITLLVVPCGVAYFALHLLAARSRWAAAVGVIPLFLFGASCMWDAFRMGQKLTHL